MYSITESSQRLPINEIWKVLQNRLPTPILPRVHYLVSSLVVNEGVRRDEMEWLMWMAFIWTYSGGPDTCKREMISVHPGKAGLTACYETLKPYFENQERVFTKWGECSLGWDDIETAKQAEGKE